MITNEEKLRFIEQKLAELLPSEGKNAFNNPSFDLLDSISSYSNLIESMNSKLKIELSVLFVHAQNEGIIDTEIAEEGYESDIDSEADGVTDNGSAADSCYSIRNFFNQLGESLERNGVTQDEEKYYNKLYGIVYEKSQLPDSLDEKVHGKVVKERDELDQTMHGQIAPTGAERLLNTKAIMGSYL